MRCKKTACPLGNINILDCPAKRVFLTPCLLRLFIIRLLADGFVLDTLWQDDIYLIEIEPVAEGLYDILIIIQMINKYFEATICIEHNG